MARHLRRLIFWFLSGLAALVLLALLALAALWWWFDPDDYRDRVAARASSAIGRQVHLTGALRWQLGRRITLVSEGGDVANVAGFGGEPLARWSRIRLGVAARPLLDRRVEIDRIDVDGLQLDLQRNAAGAVNWEMHPAQQAGPTTDQRISVRIGAIAVHDGAVRYHDARTRADWRVADLQAAVKLPDDLSSTDLQLRDAKVEGRLSGGPVAAESVQFSVLAPLLRWSPQQLQLPSFSAQWADATLSGDLSAQNDDNGFSANLQVRAPSLRALLATIGVTPPPMRDESTLGRFELDARTQFAVGAARLDDLSVKLDDTHLQGRLSVPALEPLALRFDLVADRVDLDRYREPADVKGKPLELPLAWLKQLDAKGTLRIRNATIAGAAAKDVRIDVD